LNLNVENDGDINPCSESVVCVAGAGRGPLVARCLAASQRAKRKIVLYAVEKNPNAYVT
jgi:protein arginine N-methyltransferase 5